MLRIFNLKNSVENWLSYKGLSIVRVGVNNGVNNGGRETFGSAEGSSKLLSVH